MKSRWKASRTKTRLRDVKFQMVTSLYNVNDVSSGMMDAPKLAVRWPVTLLALLQAFAVISRMWSRDSDWLRAGLSRGRNSSPGRVKNFLNLVQTGSGAHPSLLSSGYRGHSGRGVKLTIHLQLVPEVKKMWIYTSTPPYTFMA
jgi:hypothetical protein